MPQYVTKVVAYYRVSTAKQGHSGLGIEAQKRSVAEYIRLHGAKVVGEFTEVESGKVKSSDRPHLKAAIALARAKRAVLCVAKLDRVGRRAADVLNLLNDARITVAFADSPNASQLQIGILAVVAEEEARAISARTKAALAAAKARGTKLGCPNGGRALALYRAQHGNATAIVGAKRSADDFAEDTRTFVGPLVSDGLSDLAIAGALNADGIETRRGARWHETSVRRLRDRLAI